MEAKPPGEVDAGCWPSPAAPRRSVPCRSDGIVSRLSVSTATVSVSMVAGRILAAWRSWRATVDEDGHYSFAVPYDAAVRRALQSVDLRRPAILHYASWAGVLPVSQRGPLTLR